MIAIDEDERWVMKQLVLFRPRGADFESLSLWTRINVMNHIRQGNTIQERLVKEPFSSRKS